MQSSSSSNAPRSFVITPKTTVSELRQALPDNNTKIYASKMSGRGVCTLYFAPNKDANTKRVHAAVALLIGSGSMEKRMAFQKIKEQATKPLTTGFLIGILDEVQRTLPQPKVQDSTSSFSSFSDPESQSDDEESSTSFSSFSQVSLSEDADKENKPEKS